MKNLEKRKAEKLVVVLADHQSTPPADFDEYYQKWKRKEITAVSAMKILGLKSNSFYKLVHQYEKEHPAEAR